MSASIWTPGSTVSLDSESLTVLGASGGSSLIGFIQSGIGAVLRTVQSKLRADPSPEDYGCVGDGAVDDATNFNKALAAHKYVRGTPGATYLLGSHLIPQSGQWLDMRGCNVKIKDNSNAALFRIPDGVNDVTVEGGDWDGNKTNQPAGAVGFTNATAGTVLRVRLLNLTVHDCYSHNIGWNGAITKYVIETGIISYNSGASGIGSVSGVQLAAITACISYDNATSNFGGSGIHEYVAYAGCVGENPGTADNFTGYGAGTKFVTGASLIGKGGSNNGMHISGDHCAFAGIALDSPAAYGFVSRVETGGGTVGNGFVASAITVKDAGDSSFWIDNHNAFAMSAICGINPTDHNVYINTANTNGYVCGTFRAAGQSNVRISDATDIVIDGVGVDAAVGGGAVLTNTTGAIISGRYTGNATPFSETGTSNDNLYSALSATGNTSDTPSFVGASSVVDESLTGGTAAVTAAATITIPKNKKYVTLSGGTAVDTINPWRAQDGPITIRSSGNTSLTEAGNLKLVSNPLNLTDLDCVILVPDGADWYQAAPISAN